MAKLEQSRGKFGKRALTDASKRFASEAITEKLSQTLIQEFSKLGIEYVKIKLNERGDKGKIKHTLLLDIPKNTAIRDVLSEGEQRSLALAAFFAEVTIAEHKGGIIFDDPVSSLDHHRRSLVAKRILEESSKRQVIVFTHDAVFLDYLSSYAENQNQKSSIFNLVWESSKSGVVVSGLPWDQEKYTVRIDTLKKEASAIKNGWSAYPSEEQKLRLAKTYSLLRATVERVVEDFILSGVVKRFREYINLKQLESVVGLTSGEEKELQKIFKNCCAVTEAHDPPPFQQASTKRPIDLESDIGDLEALINKIRDRRKSQSQPSV